MLATFDLPAVRHFTEDVSDRMRRCDHGEGTECSTLDDSINHYARLCREMREYVSQWARAVFSCQITFDQEVETLLKTEARRLLHRAKQVAACGRQMNGECFELEGLPWLHHYVADFDYLLDNWVSPRPAVAPSSRVQVPAASRQQGIERLRKLQLLPSGWMPSDPEQLAWFKGQQGETH
jgi:hypothetical protein